METLTNIAYLHILHAGFSELGPQRTTPSSSRHSPALRLRLTSHATTQSATDTLTSQRPAG
ncbi:hypothetical protein E2C01_052619 [Portunus trituberculatus]|uniref:Uncharacterized protein n=1 Tax=Portunus trituberculatus TaxID=210409 RepID=A0A5B7GI62_PORTR|nr:hypothetical protein [Portunus trituberculatus]